VSCNVLTDEINDEVIDDVRVYVGLDRLLGLNSDHNVVGAGTTLEDVLLMESPNLNGLYCLNVWMSGESR
jgi:hypothetical protein